MRNEFVTETETLQVTHSVTEPIGRVAPGRRSLAARVLATMNSVDMFMIVFSLFLTVFATVFSARIPEWTQVVLYCAFISMMVVAINFQRNRVNEGWVRALHVFYVVPLIPIFFKTAEKISYPIHGHDFDSMLIMVDRLMTGVNPTIWLNAHIPVMPWFIEYLQVCYFLFYILPIMVAIELYRRRVERSKSHSFSDKTHDDLESLFFVILYGFCLSYVGYFFFPSIGPRFTLHNFFALDRELPGAGVTLWLRQFMNAGENIQTGMTLAQVQSVVTRDAFPSGHTDITLLTMILAFKFRAKSKWIILLLGSSLIFSTVYLRYHYVIDVVGGALFTALTLYSWKYVQRQMLRLRSYALEVVR